MSFEENLKAVQRMQDYIEEHIKDPITLKKLSQVSGYSLWHSSRIFKDLIGINPFSYIRSFRLSMAAKKLEEKETRIIDVAFDFVFDTHEGFSRSFSKQFGINPREYQKKRPSIKLFLPTKQIKTFFNHKGGTNMSDQSNPKTVFIQIVNRPARMLLLKRGIKATHYYQYCEEVGCEVWEILSSIKDALFEPIGMWLPKNMIKPGTSLYAQGVEVPLNYQGIIPDGFDSIILPSCQMMIFQGQPFKDDDYEEAISEVWDVIKDYNPEIVGYQWADDDGPRFQLAPLGYRGYMEGRPVRPVNS